MKRPPPQARSVEYPIDSRAVERHVRSQTPAGLWEEPRTQTPRVNVHLRSNMPCATSHSPLCPTQATPNGGVLRMRSQATRHQANPNNKFSFSRLQPFLMSRGAAKESMREARYYFVSGCLESGLSVTTSLCAAWWGQLPGVKSNLRLSRRSNCQQSQQLVRAHRMW